MLVFFSNGFNCFCRLLGLALANNIWLLHPHLKQDQLVICLPYLSAKPYFPTFSFFKFICSSRWPSSHIESSPQKGLPHSPVRSSLNRIQIQTHPQSQQRQLSCVERSQLKQGDVTNGDSSITILNVRWQPGSRGNTVQFSQSPIPFVWCRPVLWKIENINLCNMCIF